MLDLAKHANDFVNALGTDGHMVVALALGAVIPEAWSWARGPEFMCWALKRIRPCVPKDTKGR